MPTPKIDTPVSSTQPATTRSAQSSSDETAQELAVAADSLRVEVRSMCHSLDVELSAEREQRLATFSLERLLELVGLLNAGRCWPVGF